jgi:hypothetical protein
MTAYPLSSTSAFELQVCSLDPTTKPVGGKDPLWRKAEVELLHASPNVSLDELIALRDHLWFADAGGRDPVPLHAYLRRIAQQNLEIRGGAANPVFRQSCLGVPVESASQTAQARRAWRWLSFALPPDLLLAALWSKADKPARVNLDVPQLSQRLADQGFAETHLHLGASIDFPLLWISALYGMADSRFDERAFKSPGAAFAEGRWLAPWLLRAGLARYLLAVFLQNRALGDSGAGTFEDFLKGEAHRRLHKAFCLTELNVAVRALRDLLRGALSSDSPKFTELRALYSRLTGIAGGRFTNSRDSAHSMDPIWKLCQAPIPSGASPEMCFIADGLSYLEGTKVADRDFGILFWQVIRMRCVYYRHIVQRPMTPGLPWFVRTYSRISPGRKPLRTGIQVESAAELCGYGRGLCSLEVRTSPDGHDELRKLLKEADFAFANLQKRATAPVGSRHPPGSHQASPAEFGFVFHLARVRKGGFDEGLAQANGSQTNADPGMVKNGKGYRYSHFFSGKLREVFGLQQLLLNSPLSLQLVRGLDLCTDEMSVPTWVVAPLLRVAQDAGKIASSWLSRQGIHVPPLRLTIHSGEDYVHLLGGLRRLSETIEYLGLGEGDRLGHGVALGVNASLWAQSAGRIPVSLEQRLFDLAWEWTQYTRHSVSFEPQRLAFIEDAIGTLAKRVFGLDRFVSPAEMVDLVRDLHTEHCLRIAGFPHGNLPPTGRGPYSPLMASYLTSTDVFRQGQQNQWVVLNEQECLALENLQAHLRKRVAALGVVVEVNPSSNLLIANLGDFRQHPLWRLCPPGGNPSGARLQVCIGSDDPLTFATTLPQEYMLLHDTLMLAGLSPDDADAWLEQVRINGLNSRFTLVRQTPQGGGNISAGRRFDSPGHRLERLAVPVLFGSKPD